MTDKNRTQKDEKIDIYTFKNKEKMQSITFSIF